MTRVRVLGTLALAGVLVAGVAVALAGPASADVVPTPTPTAVVQEDPTPTPAPGDVVVQEDPAPAPAPAGPTVVVLDDDQFMAGLVGLGLLVTLAGASFVLALGRR